MSDSRKDLPSVTAPNFMDRLRETVQTYLGKQGDPLDRGLTLRDLIENGIVSVSSGFKLRSGGTVPPLVAGDQLAITYTPDLTPPPMPTGVVVTAGLTTIFVEQAPPTYLQGHGHLRSRLYGAKYTSGALPTFDDAVELTQFTGNFYTFPAAVSTTWHLWLKWETNDNVLSLPAGGTNGFVATTGKIGNTDLGPLIVEAGNLANNAVTVDKILAGAVDTAKFASGIEPVTIVTGSTVPTTKSTNTIFLTGTGKLYRWNGTAYIATVPTGDLSGTIADAQIAGLAASKVTGQLTDAQIAAVAAAKLTGQVVSTQIADAAISVAKFASSIRPIEIVSTLPATGNFAGRMAFLTTDNKLYRHNGTAWVASVASSDISGTISDAQIAGLAASKVTGQLTNSQIADVAAAKLTGQVVSAQIADAAVTTAKFASTIEPLTLVTGALPTTKSTNAIFRTDDQKVYRWNGTAYVASVATSDLSGTISDAQIAGLAASKVTGQLTNSQIADVAAAKLTGQVVASQIADAAVTTAKFASGIEPITVVSAVPGTKSTNSIFNTTDGKLYRWNGSAYVASVASSDISGTLAAAQIASLAASQITGQLTDAQIAAVAAAKLTGTISSTQIADGSVSGTKFASGLEPVTVVSAVPGTKSTNTIFNTTDGKLYRWSGSAYVATVPTSDLSGTVSDAQIAGLAAAKVTGQLSDSQIAAVGAAKVTGTLVSSQIADAAITAAKFASGIEPVEIVSALPTAGNFAGRVAFLTTDNKLYRHTGSAWVSSVASTDISGTISDAQIAALAASKVTGQLSDSQIAAVGAAKVTGQLTASQVNLTLGGTNLVPNSGFEADSNADGLADSWVAFTGGSGDVGRVQTTSRVTGAPGVLGSFAQRLAITSVTNSTDSGIVTANIATVGGAKYAASAYVRSNVAKVAMLVRWYDSGNTSILDSTSSIAPGTATWTRLMLPVTAPANAVKCDIMIRGINAATEYFEVDGVQLEASEIVTAYAPRPGEILPGTITATEISDNAITTPKLVAGAVVAGKIAANAVTANEIAAGSITTAKIAANAVTANEISAGSVTTAKIAAGAVTANEVAANAITAAKIDAGAVTTAKLAAGAVTANEIAASTITGAKIAAGTITGSNIAADTITAGQIAAGAITASEIATNAITASKIAVVDTSNLVKNPSFQGGSSDGWVLNGGTTVVAKNSAGVPAGAPAEFVVRNPLVANTNNDCSGSGDFDVRPGDVYYVEWYAASDGTANGGNRIFLQVTDQTGVGFTWPSAANTPTNSGTWTLYSGQITIPATFTFNSVTYVPARARFNFGAVGGASATGNWFVTKFHLRKANTAELIVDGAVTANKVAAGAITTAKLAAGAVTANEIAANAITAASIASGAVTTAKLAAGAVTANEIAAGAITTGKIAAGAVTATEIAADTITAAQIAAGAINASELAAGAVTAGKIAANAVTATEIAAGAITTAKLAAGAVTANEIGANAVTAAKIDAGAVTTAKLAAGAVTANEIAAATITGGKIAAGTITGSNIAADTITAGQIAAGAIGAAEIAAGAVTSEKLTVASFGDSVILNPGFEEASSSDATLPAHWTRSRIWGGTSATIYRTTSGLVRSGGASLELFPGAGGSADAFADAVPVAEGEQWYVSCRAISSGTNAGTSPGFYFRVRGGATVDDIGVELYPSAENAVVPTSWTRYEGVVTIPSGMRWARPMVLHYLTNTGCKLNIDEVEFKKVVVSASIADGAVTAAKVQAGAITTAKLAAGAVTANEIASNAITAAKIDAGAVTTAKLAAGAVTANEIAAATITGGKIAAGTITGSNIAADTITAGQIAAGAITASEVAANAITASKLTLTDLTNIAENGDFEAGQTGWDNFANITNDPTNAYAGNWVLAMPGGGGAYAVRNNLIIPVAPGEDYYADAFIKGTGTATGYVRIRGLNNANSEIWTPASTAVTGAYQQVSVTGTVPANVVRINVEIVANAGTGTVYADRVRMLRRANASLIVDGAITADKIAVNAVTAGKIATDAVTANTIAANAITAAKIEAGAVTTAKIQAGAIDATKIAAATITGDRIAANTITGSNIVADTITSVQIAAGAISASEIASGAITTDKLFVTGRGSALNDDPGCQDITTWQNGAHGSTATQVTVSDGVFGTSAFRSATGSGSSIETVKLYPVSSGKRYRISAWFRRSATGNGLIYLRPVDQAGNQISLTGLEGQTPTASWQKYAAEFVPTTAQTSVRVRAILNWTGTAGYHEVTDIRLEEKAEADLIVDGAITADKIAVNAVTAGKIATDAVTANTIAANAVTAAKIEAGAVTAAKIAAGAITANEIAGNTITGAKIAAGTITGSNIAADTITAGQIAAGAITAAEIAAGAIRAQHILVAPKSLNPDPSFEGGAATWAGFVRRLIRSNAAVPTGCPVEYASEFNVRDGMSSTYIDVVPGEVYRASCWVNRGSGSGGSGVGVVGYVLDASASIIAAFAWPNATTTASGWNRVTGLYTIPASGARLRLGVWADRPAYTGEAWYADLSVEKAADASLIVDGAITADKIAANAITAGKIAANAIAVGTAAIQNGAIVNAMLGDATITSAKIADANITSAKIADANITTAKIADLTVTTAKIANFAITNAKIGGYIASTNFDGTIDSSDVITSTGINGWAIGKGGNAVLNNAVVRGTVYATDGSFTGTINANSGYFAGTVAAGSVDVTQLSGRTLTYANASGTFSIIPNAGETRMKVTLVGGGGGGGGSSTNPTTNKIFGAGGGGGGIYRATYTVVPGTTYTLVVGAGGAGGSASGGSSGTAGGATTISGGSIATGTAGGGGGGGVNVTGAQSGQYTIYATGGAGGTGTTNGSAGGSGIESQYFGGEGWERTLTAGSGGNSAENRGSGGTGVTIMNPVNSYYRTGTAGGLYGAGGSGGMDSPGAAGARGWALIELMNPNGVVLRTEWQNLMTALQNQNISTGQ